MEHNTGGVGTGTPGTQITTGASASTKGSTAELIASTAFDSYWMSILALNYGSSATASQGALDILIGAATEELLIENLLMGYCGGQSATASTGPKRWEFPLYVPAGSRLSARAAGARVSNNSLRVAIFLYGGDGYPKFRVGTKVTTYGMGTVPDGTSITPGTSGAEGAWTQITAGTSEKHFAVIPSFQVTSDTTIQNRTFALDIGIGSATEEEIAQSYWWQTDITEHMGGPWNPRPAFVDIPSGTRLTVRASSDSALDGGYNTVLHAVS